MALIGNSTKRSGLTLLELVVAVSLAMLLTGVAMSLYLVSQQGVAVGNASSEIHGNARLAMDWITRDIRWGRQLISSRMIGTETYNTGDSELILQIPAINGSGNIIDIDNSFDYVVYHLDDSDPTVLERIVDANAASSRSDETHVVSRNVNSFSLSSGGIGLSSVPDVTALSEVAVQVNTRKVVSGNRTANETLDSIVELRNR